MRILYVIRPNAAERLGGDVVQATKTAQAVRTLGHTVDVVATAAPDAKGYDLAHVFGVFDPPLAQAQIDACTRAGTPLALSPIWWDLTELFVRSRAVERALSLPNFLVERRLRRIAKRTTQALATARERRDAGRRKDLQRTLMERAAVLLPNSRIEAERYVTDLALQHPRVHVVPNAVDDDPALASNERSSRPERDAVLCVGRVESRKNQAMLAYALRDLDVPLILAGHCTDASYRKLVERWNPRVRFAGALARPDALALMRECAVHALPAWVETPGIASLEAAQAGCAIVCGNRASEVEYFAQSAWYCDPGDAQSIRTAVISALQAARTGSVQSGRRVSAFTWASAGAETLKGYALL